MFKYNDLERKANKETIMFWTVSPFEKLKKQCGMWLNVSSQQQFCFDSLTYYLNKNTKLESYIEFILKHKWI